MLQFEIHNSPYSLGEVVNALKEDFQLVLKDEAKKKISANRSFLEQKISEPNVIYYGINTGFGSLCNVKISQDELEVLQENLVKSHACGTGYTLSEELCKLIFLLKIINLSKGYSGVRLSLVEHMIKVFNAQIYPVIYEQGSLGASGDLAPLAHLSLTLIGYGKVYYKGKVIDSKNALEESKISAITLAAKEGLALLNGTQFSLAHAILCVDQANKAIKMSNNIAALSLQAYACSKEPFDALIGMIRNNKDQSAIASEILLLTEDSLLMGKIYSVQDPYSFRCIPQVHGASLTAIKHVSQVVENELNAVTDNPNIFHIENKIISAGNFHAQSLALVLDYLCLAVAELGSISERRIFQLIHGERDLPSFLVKNAGLNSGYMIAQYTAASIVSQSKQLCTPASIDSIPSSRGQEDHVSMAANGATKCIKVCDNSLNILAIELMVSTQALDFRNVGYASTQTKKLYQKVRDFIPHMEHDRILHDEILICRAIVNNYS